MANSRILIVNYGMGNIWSIQNALNYLGMNSDVLDDPDKFKNYEFIILPGVGSFSKASKIIFSKGLDQAIINSIKSKGSKLLGICLGMQLLGSSSNEDGFSKGLGLIKNKVKKMPLNNKLLKIPHIGFNNVHVSSDESVLFKNIDNNSDFYFVHSFGMEILNKKYEIGISKHTYSFVSAIESENIFGTQFHPEKSQKNGLNVLKNFLCLND